MSSIKQISQHNLILGDCLTEMKLIDDETFDVVVTSPPYNIDVKYNTYQDKKDDYLTWIDEVFISIKRVLKKSGSFFLNIGYTGAKPWIYMDVANIARKHFILQNNFIWVKSVSVDKISYGNFKPINSKRFVNQLYENVFHFTINGDVELDRMAIGVPYKDKSNIERFKTKDIKCRGNVWFIPYKPIQSKKEKGNHPAIFPIELPEMCIKIHGVYSGMKVLDPFVGIGTTLVAADRLLVSGTGIEIDPDYYANAEQVLIENSGRMFNETLL